MANSTPFPVPERWTRRIRFAIVDTLALADSTLTVARDEFGRVYWVERPS